MEVLNIAGCPIKIRFVLLLHFTWLMTEIATLLVLQAVTRVHHERQPSLQEQMLREEPSKGERNYPLRKRKKKKGGGRETFWEYTCSNGHQNHSCPSTSIISYLSRKLTKCSHLDLQTLRPNMTLKKCPGKFLIILLFLNPKPLGYKLINITTLVP